MGHTIIKWCKWKKKCRQVHLVWERTIVIWRYVTCFETSFLKGRFNKSLSSRQILSLSSQKEASGSEWSCQILMKRGFFFLTCHSGGVWRHHRHQALPIIYDELCLASLFLPYSPSLPLSTPNAFCVSFPGGSVESDSLQMWFIYRPVLHILSGLLRFPHWDRHR